MTTSTLQTSPIKHYLGSSCISSNLVQIYANTPTDPFTTLELQNSSDDVLEQDEIRRFLSCNIVIGPVGYLSFPIESLKIIYSVGADFEAAKL